MNSTELLTWGVFVHLIADWLLQNDWIAINKPKLAKSFAGWLHGAIHFALFAMVFPIDGALILAGSHIFIDTRFLLAWVRKLAGQGKPGNPYKEHVEIWHDQVVHILIIGTMSILYSKI